MNTIHDVPVTPAGQLARLIHKYFQRILANVDTYVPNNNCYVELNGNGVAAIIIDGDVYAVLFADSSHVLTSADELISKLKIFS